MVGKSDNLGSPKEEPKEKPEPKVELPEPQPPSERPQGDNYRTKAMKNKLESHLKILKEQRQELTDKYSGRAGLEDALKSLDTNVDLIKKDLADIDNMKRKVDLPNIPMGKNTHTNKTNDGFVYNKSRIKVDPKLKENMGLKQQLAVIQSGWNDLPDDVRDIVKTLNIKMSRASGRSSIRGGSWVDSRGELVLNIHKRTGMSAMHHFYHEIGHARFHKIQTDQPEKVKKFEEQVRKIGKAPTKYAESYKHAVDRESDWQRRKIKQITRGGIPLSDKNKKILEQRTEAIRNIYENETHSELNAYAMGELSDSDIIVVNDTMKGLLNAYKELWGIER